MHRITETREGFNPLTQETTTYTRRVIMEEDYSEALLQRIILP